MYNAYQVGKKIIALRACGLLCAGKCVTVGSLGTKVEFPVFAIFCGEKTPTISWEFQVTNQTSQNMELERDTQQYRLYSAFLYNTVDANNVRSTDINTRCGRIFMNWWDLNIYYFRLYYINLFNSVYII